MRQPEPEKEELLVEISADLPAELAMKLVSSMSAVRVLLPLRLPDVYDPLQILLEAIGSQEVGFLMVQSTIDPVFIRNDLPRHAICALFEVPSTTASWLWKPIPHPPPWFSHNASMLIPRPPSWPY